MSTRLLWIAAALLLMRGEAFAQQPAAEPPADGGTTEVLQSLYIPPLAHAPFTVKLHTEWVRVLPDGSTITLSNDRVIARDSEGRIFEERRGLMPPHGDSTTPLSWLQFADPATHVAYNCSPATRLCHMIAFNTEVDEEHPRSFRNPRSYPTSSQIEQSDLGSDRRNGVDVRGTRTVTTIKAGSIGNSKPISVERQFWYSQELGINLYSLRSDPRIGVQSFTVTDLDRNEPDPKTFLLPSGYKIVDDRAPASSVDR